jgi:hypothetical protein
MALSCSADNLDLALAAAIEMGRQQACKDWQ